MNFVIKTHWTAIQLQVCHSSRCTRCTRCTNSLAPAFKTLLQTPTLSTTSNLLMLGCYVTDAMIVASLINWIFPCSWVFAKCSNQRRHQSPITITNHNHQSPNHNLGRALVEESEQLALPWGFTRVGRIHCWSGATTTTATCRLPVQTCLARRTLPRLVQALKLKLCIAIKYVTPHTVVGRI